MSPQKKASARGRFALRPFPSCPFFTSVVIHHLRSQVRNIPLVLLKLNLYTVGKDNFVSGNLNVSNKLFSRLHRIRAGLAYFEAVSKHQMEAYFIKWGPILIDKMKTGSHFSQNLQVNRCISSIA